MSDPFIGEIRLFAFARVPDGWLPCNGQPLPIPQFTTLFAVIGTTYGGDGNQSFNAPDLRGRVPSARVRGRACPTLHSGKSAERTTTPSSTANCHRIATRWCRQPLQRTRRRPQRTCIWRRPRPRFFTRRRQTRRPMTRWRRAFCQQATAWGITTSCRPSWRTIASASTASFRRRAEPAIRVKRA
jgi:Phage Tail Collar Domain